MSSERNKTLTGLAATEPVTGATQPQAQRLQWFLTESTWSAQGLNEWRLERWRQTPGLAPHTQ